MESHLPTGLNEKKKSHKFMHDLTIPRFDTLLISEVFILVRHLEVTVHLENSIEKSNGKMDKNTLKRKNTEIKSMDKAASQQ